MTPWWVKAGFRETGTSLSKSCEAYFWGPAGPLGQRLVGRKSFSHHSWVLAGGRHAKSTNAFPEHIWRSPLASHHTPRNINSVFPGAVAATPGVWLEPMLAQSKFRKTMTSLPKGCEDYFWGLAGPLGQRLVGRESFSQHYWVLAGRRYRRRPTSSHNSHHTSRNNNSLFPMAVAATP